MGTKIYIITPYIVLRLTFTPADIDRIDALLPHILRRSRDFTTELFSAFIEMLDRIGAYIMDYLTDLMLFSFGLLVGNYAFSMVIFPLFYGLPKSLWLVSRRRLRWWTPLLFFMLPLAFCATLLFIVFFLDIFQTLAESFAYGLALHLMFGFALMRWAFSQSERTKLRSAFERLVAPNCLDSLGALNEDKFPLNR